MTKIAYNSCFGGFSLSRAAMIRYAELTGGQFCEDRYPMIEWPDGSETDAYEYDRSDPNLIAVIEELGALANGSCSNIELIDVQNGTRYRIDEYDGYERVMRVEDYEWEIA